MGLWEWLNGNDVQQQLDRNELNRNRTELNRVSRRDGYESDDYLLWNSKVRDSMNRTSWWDWFIGDDPDKH